MPVHPTTAAEDWTLIGEFNGRLSIDVRLQEGRAALVVARDF